MKTNRQMAEEMVTWFTTELDLLERNYVVKEDAKGYKTRLVFSEGMTTSIQMRVLTEMMIAEESYWKKKGRNITYNFTLTSYDNKLELFLHCYEIEN